MIPDTPNHDAHVRLYAAWLTRELQMALDDFLQSATACGYGDDVFWQRATRHVIVVDALVADYGQDNKNA